MVINGKSLLNLAPIIDMEETKLVGSGGVSYGLGEAGYDIRIAQQVTFGRKDGCRMVEVAVIQNGISVSSDLELGTFALASGMEEFNMPECLTGIVHDKSTWARQGLSVFNTVIEPGWKGFLTLELVYHGNNTLVIPAGAGIAQIMFHSISDLAAYGGKYQNQANEPVPSIFIK